jgi:hypothetical protein
MTEVAVFFRIDHPELKKKVDSLGELVTKEQIKELDKLALKITKEDNLDEYMGHRNCMKETPSYEEWRNNDKYVEKKMIL